MDELPQHPAQEPRRKSRPGFHDKTIRGLSVALIVVGAVSMGMGIAALVIALLSMCKFYSDSEYYYHGHYGPTTTTTPYYIDHCGYYHSYMSPGIWGGIMFTASGIIGFLSAKRKTTCFIVSMMAMALVTAWIAVISLVVSIWANFDVRYNQVNQMPISLRVVNAIVSLTALLAFIFSWVKFGFACRAICCNGLKGYPKIKERLYQYQPLPTQPMMYAQAPAGGAVPAPVFHSQPAPPPTNTPEPIYLIQGHEIIGVLPQNPNQPMMPNTAPAVFSDPNAAAPVVA